MRKFTVVCDPISEKASVQFGVLKMIIKALDNENEIKVISPYIPEEIASKLARMGNISIISTSSVNKVQKFIFSILGNNEAMLWGISWLFEAFFSLNSSITRKNTCDENSIVLNASYTAPVKCKLFWNQATPPLITLSNMGKTNMLAHILYLFGRRILTAMDNKVSRKHFQFSEKFVNNSRYLKELYEELGHQSTEVLHTPKEFSEFNPPRKPPTRDYVLAYIGKEVEIDTILELADKGIKIVSFGAKLPFGVPVAELKRRAGFLGFVDDNKLSELYYNALYTAFPFTDEPFGWVPLESMQHGTAVLSYNKQGPSETILDGKTGWLTDNKEAFLEKGIKIWNLGTSDISPTDCMDRVKDFTVKPIADRLNELLAGEDH